jgi:hypothetical protein
MGVYTGLREAPYKPPKEENLKGGGKKKGL